MSLQTNTYTEGNDRQTDNTLIQLFRYTFVGGLAFIVDFGSLVSLTEFVGFHYLYSAAIAFLFGLVTNYALSVIWVFDHRIVKHRSLEFLIFTGIGVVGLGLNEVFIWSFTEKIHLPYMISKGFATLFVFLWNFFARKYSLFRQGSAA